MSIIILNYASNLKMCWDLMNSEESWAILLKDRVLGNCIWSGIKPEYATLFVNTLWFLGNGDNINFSQDA